MTCPSPLSVMPPQAERAARIAGIAGARALVSEIHFDALVTLLVRSGAVPREAAQAMLSETALRLSTYVCSFEPEWRPCRDEIAMNVRRLEKMAREIELRPPKEPSVGKPTE